uniref:Uncharacterized protein n=1 Tax=viral metagenome TaxID=1070528 RepID=A0A6C0DAH4_9ZZZZ
MSYTFNPKVKSEFTVEDTIDDDDVEDIGTIDDKGFTPTKPKPLPKPLGSRVPQPRITSMAYKNRGSLVNNVLTPPPKKISYDDILSSLNMQVVNGQLQIVRNVTAENIKNNNINPTNQNTIQFNNNQFNNQKNSQFNQTKKIIQQPYQNSNTYYQNSVPIQTHQQQQPIQEVPIMNKEQIKQMVISHNLNVLEQQQRINNIKNVKSKRMMFSS